MVKKYWWVTGVAILAGVVIIGSGLINKRSSRETVELTTGKTVKVAGIKLTLIIASVPDDKCRDCLTFARVKAERGNEEKVLDFKIGGFAGLMVKKQEAFGYNFGVEKIEKDRVELKFENLKE